MLMEIKPCAIISRSSDGSKRPNFPQGHVARRKAAARSERRRNPRGGEQLGLARRSPRTALGAGGSACCRSTPVRLARQHEMILGIDIGVRGAVAVLDQSGALVEIHDMPTLQDGPAGRRLVNAPLLAALVFKSAGGGS